MEKVLVRRKIFLQRYLRALRDGLEAPKWDLANDNAVIDDDDDEEPFPWSEELVKAEIASGEQVLAKIANWRGCMSDVRRLQRRLVAKDTVYDFRATSKRYISKQPVEYCAVLVDGHREECCKTIAIELANTYTPLPMDENTRENYTLWYFRTGRFNISEEKKRATLKGTIYYAERMIMSAKKELGMPTRRTHGFLAKLNKNLEQGGSLPSGMMRAVCEIAGLPYGLFGVKALRPAKQDF